MGTSKLGNMLVEDGLLSETDRRTIKRTCGTGGSAFARGILAMGLLDEDELAAYIAEHTQWQVASKGLLDNIQSGAWGCIDRPLVEHLEVLPLRLMGESLQVAMVDPLDQDTLSQLEFFTGYKILPVIATMSQVRGGLQKVLPDFHPSSSQLEDFLKNHSISASKRIRMEEQSDYDDMPAPEAFSVQSAPAARVEPRFTPPANADHIEFDTDEDVEVGFAEPESAAPAAGASARDTSGDDDNLFSIEDDNFGTEIEDDAGGAPVAAASSANISISDDISLDMDGGSADDLSDLSDDLFAADNELETGDDDGLTATPSPMNAAVAGADDLGDLGDDLSAFDPDLEGGDLDFGADLEADLGGGKAAAPKSTAAAAEAAPAAADWSEDLGDMGDLGDIGDLDAMSGLDADFSDNPGAGLEADLSGDMDLAGEMDLTGDTVAAATSEGGLLDAEDGDLGLDFEAEAELTADLTGETDSGIAAGSDDVFGRASDGDDDGLSFDEGNDLSGDLPIEESSDLDGEPNAGAKEELSFDEGGELSFDEGGELSFDEGSELSFDEPAALAQDLDIAASAMDDVNDAAGAMPDIAVSGAPEQISAAINKMLFAVTMSAQTKEAISQIAPDLKAAGFSAGMVIGGSAGSGFRPECGWLESDGQPSGLSADAFKAKGIAAALGRLTPAWSALDDAVRQGDLKVFASLQRENRRLFGIRFQNPSSGSDTVIVTAMTEEIAGNQALMEMASDLFRQVARKDKTAA